MNAAIKLLDSGSYTVSAIAGRVGYNSLTCFYEAFKKRFGILPGQYKRKNKDGQNDN